MRRPSRPEKRASKSTRKHFNGKRATQISYLHKHLNTGIGWFPLLLDASILTQLWSNFCTDKRRAGQLYEKLNAVHVWLSPLPSQGSKADQAVCELAVKYPLLHAAVNFKDLQYSKASIGKHGKGRYRLEVWSLPADRVPQLPLVEQHPILDGAGCNMYRKQAAICIMIRHQDVGYVLSLFDT